MTEPKQTEGQRIAYKYALHSMQSFCAKDIDDALSAERLKAQGLVDAWRPIVTAPRDGSEILIWAIGDGTPCAVIATWNTRKDFWQSPDGSVGYEASHWMPLPNAPEEKL